MLKPSADTASEMMKPMCACERCKRHAGRLEQGVRAPSSFRNVRRDGSRCDATRIGVKERILDPTKGAAHPSGSVSLFYTIGFISGVCLPRGTSQISCFLRSS